jgi:hypothetical protein
MASHPDEAGSVRKRQPVRMKPIVQLLAYRFGPDAAFEGRLVGALERMESGGTLRVLDVLFVGREEPNPLRGLGEALPPGGGVGAVLVEHVWARALGDAVDQSSGSALLSEFVDGTELTESSPGSQPRSRRATNPRSRRSPRPLARRRIPAYSTLRLLLCRMQASSSAAARRSLRTSGESLDALWARACFGGEATARRS